MIETVRGTNRMLTDECGSALVPSVLGELLLVFTEKMRQEELMNGTGRRESRDEKVRELRQSDCRRLRENKTNKTTKRKKDLI